jgi:hypothetical protein
MGSEDSINRIIRKMLADDCDASAIAERTGLTIAAIHKRISRIKSLENPTSRICPHPGCTRPRHHSPLCAAHTRRKKLGLPMDSPIGQRGGSCGVFGCGRIHYSGGLCLTHGNRKRRGRTDWDAPIRRYITNQPGRQIHFRLIKKSEAILAAEAKRRRMSLSVLMREIVNEWAMFKAMDRREQ